MTGRMSGREVIRVIDRLETSGIPAGLTGGWGIDALLGHQTRPHRDVDLGIAASQVDRAIEALTAIGYSLVVDERPARIELAGRRGRVDLHPIDWDRDGAGTQVGFDGRTFSYPPGSLAAVGTIDGHAVRCGTPELQIAFHVGYEPTDTDRQDMAALADSFGVSLPEPYSGWNLERRRRPRSPG